MTKGFQRGNRFGFMNKGKKRSEEFKNQLRKRMKKLWELGLSNGFKGGINNPNWNPNREEINKNLRNNSFYIQWVKQIKKRDKECQLKDNNCDGYLVVHHIKSWRDYPELRYELTNGITLCQAHHPSKRAEEKQLESIFMNLIETNV